MNHLVPLALALCLLSSAHGQWVLDGDWSGDGRKVEASDRWEVPVSISLAAGEVVLLNAAYDADGQVVSRWRGFTSWGSQSWEGEGEVGERPVDAVHGTAQARWFMLSEMPAAVGDTLGSLMRIRAFDGSAPVGEWGAGRCGRPDSWGPSTRGAASTRGPTMPGAEDLWNWLLVSGAAFDSCCAHQEWPALSILSAGDGSYHPDFGQEGRIVPILMAGRSRTAFAMNSAAGSRRRCSCPGTPTSPTRMTSTTSAFRRRNLRAGQCLRPSGDVPLGWNPRARLRRGHHDPARGRQPEPRGARPAPPLEWLGPDAGVHVLLGTPEGEPTLAGGTMSAGWVPPWPEASPGSSTTSINPGLTTNDPVRSVALAAGFGWKLEDETVVVGTRDIEPGWDGVAHPVWWTGPHMAFGGVNAYWTEDTEFLPRVALPSAWAPGCTSQAPCPVTARPRGPGFSPAGQRMCRVCPASRPSRLGPFLFPPRGRRMALRPGDHPVRDDRGRLLGSGGTRGAFPVDLPKRAAGSGPRRWVASGPTAELTRTEPGFGVDKPGDS